VHLSESVERRNAIGSGLRFDRREGCREIVPTTSRYRYERSDLVNRRARNVARDRFGFAVLPRQSRQIHGCTSISMRRYATANSSSLSDAPRVAKAVRASSTRCAALTMGVDAVL
jgi:hypothetical protein